MVKTIKSLPIIFTLFRYIFLLILFVFSLILLFNSSPSVGYSPNYYSYTQTLQKELFSLLNILNLVFLLFIYITLKLIFKKISIIKIFTILIIIFVIYGSHSLSKSVLNWRYFKTIAKNYQISGYNRYTDNQMFTKHEVYSIYFYSSSQTFDNDIKNVTQKIRDLTYKVSNEALVGTEIISKQSLTDLNKTDINTIYQIIQDGQTVRIYFNKPPFSSLKRIELVMQKESDIIKYILTARL